MDISDIRIPGWLFMAAVLVLQQAIEQLSALNSFEAAAWAAGLTAVLKILQLILERKPEVISRSVSPVASRSKVKRFFLE